MSSAGLQSAPPEVIAGAECSHETKLSANALLLMPVAVALLLGWVFIASATGTQDDDGYIFYQYARNLASGLGLSFNPGQVSYGVTSGAWVFALAAVHALVPLDVVREAQLTGLIFFALSAAVWSAAAARWTGRTWIGATSSLLYVLELDGLKASIIGLETALNLLCIALLALLMARGPLRSPLALGLVGGLALLTRPDNAVWVAVALVYGIARDRQQVRRALAAGALAAAVVAPWYGWIWVSTGSPIPPTQIGKMLIFLPMNLHLTLDEFQQLGLLGRLGVAASVLRDFAITARADLLGCGVLLLATLGLTLRSDTRKFAPWPTLLLLSILLQAGLYAWSFPLLKLRYLINIVPVGLVGGSAAALLSLALAANRFRPAAGWSSRLLVPGVAVSLLAVAVYARAVESQVAHYRYYSDVQAVRGQVGLWLREHTEPGSLVALEPIGEVGFYADRPVLDLGGLTDSSTWPALKRGFEDGAALAELLGARQAQYLVDYTSPEGIGGASNALPFLKGAKQVAVLESDAARLGNRSEYSSYTIYRLRDDGSF